MNHNIRELVTLAAAGKLTPEQWMELPPELQEQLMPFLMRRDPKEIRRIANEIAKGASWGLFTTGLQQMALLYLGLIVFAILFLIVVFLLAAH